MESTEISKLFIENINKILTPQGYKHIISKDNNLFRFDVINRLLIEIQCKDAFDVRTADEWEINNRKVKKKSKGINILIPMYSTQYIDVDTREPINIEEFTADELMLALKLNIIEKIENIDTMFVKEVFDIKQTNSYDNYKYIPYKPVIKSSTLIEIVRDITGCLIEKSDITYYSKSDNKFMVNRQSYTQLSKYVVDVLVEYYMNNYITDSIISEYKYTEYDLDLIRLTIQYSLDTLLITHRDADFDIVNHTSTDKLINILTITDSIVFNVIEKIDYTGASINKDITFSINNLKKAEALLDIMEANNISKIMKGA